MSIDIHFDIEGAGFNDVIAPQVVSAVEGAIGTSLNLIFNQWQASAQTTLHSTLPDYLMGLQATSIQQPYDDPLTGAVVLMGDLPNSIESGWGPFDEKPGFMASSKAHKTDKGGWYMNVPFRHGTPGSIGVGTPMTRDIYGVAKTLDAYGSSGTNQRLSVPGQGDISWNGYQRKNNINDGMVRIEKTYKNATQSMYYTWRRVSNSSDPQSWWHPGYKGAHIAEKVEPFARTTFNQAMSQALSHLGR